MKGHAAGDLLEIRKRPLRVPLFHPYHAKLKLGCEKGGVGGERPVELGGGLVGRLALQREARPVARDGLLIVRPDGLVDDGLGLFLRSVASRLLVENLERSHKLGVIAALLGEDDQIPVRKAEEFGRDVSLHGLLVVLGGEVQVVGGALDLPQEIVRRAAGALLHRPEEVLFSLGMVAVHEGPHADLVVARECGAGCDGAQCDDHGCSVQWSIGFHGGPGALRHLFEYPHPAHLSTKQFPRTPKAERPPLERGQLYIYITHNKILAFYHFFGNYIKAVRPRRQGGGVRQADGRTPKKKEKP